MLPFARHPFKITFSLLVIILSCETYVSCLMKLHLIRLWYLIQWHIKLLPSYKKTDMRHRKSSALFPSREPKKACRIISSIRNTASNRKTNSPFIPYSSDSLIPSTRNEETTFFSIFCSCRRPEIIENTCNGAWTAQCNVCQEWFHEDCESISH